MNEKENPIPCEKGKSIGVRRLKVGEFFQKFDMWNCAEGLRRIPFAKIGQRINYIQPRDIFLRPISLPDDITQEEWENDWDYSKYE